MLLNCTNHPYQTWGDKLCKATAALYGEVKECPFPHVDPLWDTDELRRQVGAYADRIEAERPDAVLVAGEFTFLFMLVDRLLSDGVEVVCTCSSRNTTETVDEHGNNVKRSVFVFERFRPYTRWHDA